MRGVNTQTNCLLNSSSTSDFSIIAITETWLNSTVNSVEFFHTHKYTVYRCDGNFSDTNTTRGGGVALEINSVDLKRNSSTCFKDLSFIDILGAKDFADNCTFFHHF